MGGPGAVYGSKGIPLNMFLWKPLHVPIWPVLELVAQPTTPLSGEFNLQINNGLSDEKDVADSLVDLNQNINKSILQLKIEVTRKY
jgi:hypothetical protein